MSNFYDNLDLLKGKKVIKTPEELSKEKKVLIEFQASLDSLNKYYGGNPLELTLFKQGDKDFEGRSNDTIQSRIPIASNELKTKTLAPYSIYSRAGHRFVAPADDMIHFSTIETIIQRINKNYIELPDMFFEEIDKEDFDKDSQFKIKYFMKLLTNTVWDLLNEDRMPYLLPEKKQFNDYIKGRKFYLEKANIKNLPPSPLKRIKELQYLLMLEIHRQQDKNSGIPPCPDPEIYADLQDVIALLRNERNPLIKRANLLMPKLIELLEKIDEKDKQQGQGQGGGGSGKGSGKGSGGGSAGLMPPNMGNGNRKFGNTFLDYYDPSRELTEQEKAQIQNEVQKTMDSLGEDFRGEPDSGKSNQLSSDVEEKTKGFGIGAGYFKVVEWHDSSFAKRQNRKQFNPAISDILSNSLQATKKFIGNRKHVQERIGNRVWTTADNPRHLLVETSLQQYGLLIPNTTTLMPMYGDGKNNPTYDSTADLIIMIDVSGSMSAVLNNAIEAAISACKVALHDGGRISAIAFHSYAVEVSPPTKDITTVIDRLSCLFPTGGTSIEAALDVLLQHLITMRNANVLMITDCGIYDYRDPKTEAYYNMILQYVLNFMVCQVPVKGIDNKDFMEEMKSKFPKTDFFMIEKNKRFTDSVLKTISV